MVPALARPAAATRAFSSFREDSRDGTGRLALSQCVGAWEEEKPAAPAAMASVTMPTISPPRRASTG